jgi:hypothetical protein
MYSDINLCARGYILNLCVSHTVFWVNVIVVPTDPELLQSNSAIGVSGAAIGMFYHCVICDWSVLLEGM